MRVESAAPNSRLITRLDRLSAAMWLLFAVLLPFELKTPLMTIGPLSITNVELAMYGVIGLWAVRAAVSFRAALRRDLAERAPTPHCAHAVGASVPAHPAAWEPPLLTRTGLHLTPVHWAALIWLGANLISALLAPTLRAEALKFALRSATGVLLFFAAADWARADVGARTPDRVARIALALGVGALVSAGAGIIEVAIPASVPLWLAFKTHVTVVGEVLRASGTFQYANTAAMFWEAALPIGLAAIIATRRAGSRRGSIGLWVSVIAIDLAIVLTASRAALVGAAIALLMLIGLNRGALRRWAAVALSGLVALTIMQLLLSPVIAARYRAESDRMWFVAQIEIAPQALTLHGALMLHADEIVSVPVTITNASVRTWPASGSNPVSVSYHWLSADSQDMIVYEGVRTALPYDLAPGDRVPIEARVKAPTQPGNYRLQIDLVQEHVTWFSVRTGQVVEVPARVTGAPPTPPPAVPQMTLLPRPLPSQTRTELWRVAIELWRTRPLIGIGPDNFRWTYGTVLGAINFNNTVTANSWYVETLVNTGLIGLVGLIGLGVTLAWAAYRALREPAGVNRTMVPGLIAALLAFAVHGVVDYFLPFTPTYGLFWLAAGLLTGRAWSRA